MSDFQDILTYIAIVSAIVITVYFFMESIRKPGEPETETRELLVCGKCDYKVETRFEPGDFIGMIKGECPKCGSHLKIKAIYDVVKEEKNLKARRPL